MTYALGIGVDEFNGLVSYSHGGADIAHRAYAVYFPEINAGVVAMSNNANFPSWRIATTMAEAFFADDMVIEEEEVGSEEPDLDGTAAEGPDPERQAASLEIHGGIRQCLSRLPRPRRIAVVCHLQGYSVPVSHNHLESRFKSQLFEMNACGQ